MDLNNNKIDYSMPKLGRSKWITFIFVIFFLGLFVYFPITYKVKDIIKTQLSQIRGCPLQYEDIKSEFFFPKLIIENLVIPMSCFQQFGQPLRLEKSFLHFRGISFSPFGPHFKLETSLLKNDVSAYLTVGIGGIALNIKNNNIDLAKLSPILPKVKLAGKLNIDALVRLNSGELEDLKLNLISKDFALPAQSIQGFKITNLKLNSFLLKVQTEGKKLMIKDFILGDANAAIRSNFKGHIAINSKNFLFSNLDLNGEVSLSSMMMEKYAFLKIIMAQFDKKDEYYQIKLKGTLQAPQTVKDR